MKRIQAACICQTLHFQYKDGVPKSYGAKQVQEEVAAYKRYLEKNHIQHRITQEEPQPDGSVLLKIIKQYNQSPVGDYLKK